MLRIKIDYRKNYPFRGDEKKSYIEFWRTRVEAAEEEEGRRGERKKRVNTSGEPDGGATF